MVKNLILPLYITVDQRILEMDAKIAFIIILRYIDNAKDKTCTLFLAICSLPTMYRPILIPSHPT